MKKLYAIIVLALISMGNAIYLTISAFNYQAWDTSKLACDINDTLSCSSLFSFEFAWIFGIPFPAIAMVVYPIISIIAFLWVVKKCKKSFEIILWLGIWGILFNSYIIYNEFQIWIFCPACLACTASIVTIAILSLIWVKSKKAISN